MLGLCGPFGALVGETGKGEGARGGALDVFVAALSFLGVRRSRRFLLDFIFLFYGGHRGALYVAFWLVPTGVSIVVRFRCQQCGCEWVAFLCGDGIHGRSYDPSISIGGQICNCGLRVGWYNGLREVVLLSFDLGPFFGLLRFFKRFFQRERGVIYSQGGCELVSVVPNVFYVCTLVRRSIGDRGILRNSFPQFRRHGRVVMDLTISCNFVNMARQFTTCYGAIFGGCLNFTLDGDISLGNIKDPDDARSVVILDLF